MAAKGKRTTRTPKKRSKPDWAPKLLLKLAETANIKAACKAAKVGRTAFYGRRETDAVFAKAVQEALEEATDDLELEARRRAKDGTQKPVYYQGLKCGVINEYSDTLMIFLLKAHRPEKFRDKVKVEHGGIGGGAIPHKHEHTGNITADLAPYADAIRGVLAEGCRVPPLNPAQPVGGPEAAHQGPAASGPVPHA